MDDLYALRRDLDEAKIRRVQAFKRFGEESSQFAAATTVVEMLETKIKEAQGR